MITNTRLKICTIIILITVYSISYAALDMKPSFESCSIYLPYEEEVECLVSYKKASETEWHPAYAPIYDTGKKEFRGSLVRLSENTDYQVKAELYSGGIKLTQYTGSFTTWNGDVPVVRTEDISKYKSGNVYVVNNVNGTANGWIRITGVDTLSTNYNDVNEEDVVLMVQNSKYVIIEGLAIRGGRRHGMCILKTCNNVRVINCDIAKWGRPVINQTKGGQFLDRDGKEINHDAGIYMQSPTNIVVERCYIHDSKSRTNAWSGTVEMGQYKGQTFSSAHPQGPNAIFIDQAKGGVVLRYNDLVGSQNHRYNDPVETSDNSYWDGGFNKDADIYGNMIAFGQDDGIELDGGQNNIRTYDNRFEQTYCGISTAPNRQGPSYIFNNVVWNLGDSRPSTNVSVKNGGGDMVNELLGQYPGRNFFFNNTFIAPKNGITGVGYGDGSQREMFHATTRNNILISKTKPVNPSDDNGTGLCISDQHKTSDSDYDYDLLGNTTDTIGAGAIWAREGSEPHGFFALPQFVDEAHGVLTLRIGDVAVDKGIFIPNFSGQYQSIAPDLGAFEFGASSLFPKRPLDISSDKYYVTMNAEHPVETITLTIGEIGTQSDFDIRKDDEMSWLTVTPDVTRLKPHSSVKLTLTAGTTNGKQSGVMFFRLSNGLSVPITVVAQTGEYQYPQLYVTSDADSGEGSLRQIIADAYDNDEITIPGEFIIKLDSAIVFDKTLKFHGNGATVRVANPGISPYRIFSIGNSGKPAIPATIVLDNLILLGGDVCANGIDNNGGAVFINTSKSLKMRNCTVTSGKAFIGGGLMTTHPSARSVFIENCTFENNTATSAAGGAYLAGSGTVSVNNTVFKDNLTQDAASALISKCIATNISGCYFKNNVASPGTRAGAALYYAFDNEVGTMKVENSTFEGNMNNYAPDGGGAFFGNGSSKAITIFTNCTFYNNKSSRGAVYDYNGKVTVINCTFAGNTGTSASYGSAFYAYDNANVKPDLVNNIIAYNYGGQAAVYFGSRSVETGTNNLIESYAGKNPVALLASLTYVANQDIFSNYIIINGKKIPQIDDETHTLPVTEKGLAAHAGIAGYANFVIPLLDQRGKQRGNPPYLGAYEYRSDEFPSGNMLPQQRKYSFIVMNPVVDRLIIRNHEHIRQLRICNMDGKVVCVKTLPEADIPLRNISNGFYMVHFETDEGCFYEKLVVK